MKKKMVLVACSVALAGIASADISVSMFNSSGFVKAGVASGNPAGGVLPTGTLVQLVWKADTAGYKTDDLDLSLKNSGEFILFSGFANENWGKFTLGSVLAGNSAVDGADIHTGNFYARIFDSATPVAGSYFLEMGLQSAPLKVFSALDAGSSYSASLNNLGVTFASIDSQGTQVIPEPATFGLMGIAGLGLFLARKKARR